jgi:hypothetical protein
MGNVEDIMKLKREGRQDQEIAYILEQRGASQKEIQEALNAAQIKNAISKPESPNNYQTISVNNPKESNPSQIQEMYNPYEPSPMENAPSNESAPPTYPEEYQTPYPQDSQGTPPAQENYSPQEYPQYSASSASPELMDELIDQVITQKLSKITDRLEKALDFKNIIETKVDYLQDRLKRIESTIDRLQLSVLQKVGDQLTGLDDIKKEIQETQKSFKSLIEKKK